MHDCLNLLNKYLRSFMHVSAFLQASGDLDSLKLKELRAGTVLLFISMATPGRRGTTVTARSIASTGYVRQNQNKDAAFCQL